MAGTSANSGVVQAADSSAGSAVRRTRTANCSRVTAGDGQKLPPPHPAATPTARQLLDPWAQRAAGRYVAEDSACRKGPARSPLLPWRRARIPPLRARGRAGGTIGRAVAAARHPVVQHGLDEGVEPAGTRDVGEAVPDVQPPALALSKNVRGQALERGRVPVEGGADGRIEHADVVAGAAFPAAASGTRKYADLGSGIEYKLPPGPVELGQPAVEELRHPAGVVPPRARCRRLHRAPGHRCDRPWSRCRRACRRPALRAAALRVARRTGRSPSPSSV